MRGKRKGINQKESQLRRSPPTYRELEGSTGVLGPVGHETQGRAFFLAAFQRPGSVRRGSTIVLSQPCHTVGTVTDAPAATAVTAGTAVQADIRVTITAGATGTAATEAIAATAPTVATGATLATVGPAVTEVVVTAGITDTAATVAMPPSAFTAATGAAVATEGPVSTAAMEVTAAMVGTSLTTATKVTVVKHRGMGSLTGPESQALSRLQDQALHLARLPLLLSGLRKLHVGLSQPATCACSGIRYQTHEVHNTHVSDDVHMAACAGVAVSHCLWDHQ